MYFTNVPHIGVQILGLIGISNGANTKIHLFGTRAIMVLIDLSKPSQAWPEGQTGGGQGALIQLSPNLDAVDGLFHSLGAFDFGDKGSVYINNRGSNGYVILDAVQYLLVTE